MTNNNPVYNNDNGAKHYRDYTPIYNYGKRVKLGKYGTMAQEYLKESAPLAYIEYSKYDEFKYILAKIEEDADNMMQEVKAQLKKQYPMPKTNNFSKLAKYSNFIESKAETIVINSVVLKMHISDDEVIKAQSAKHSAVQ